MELCIILISNKIQSKIIDLDLWVYRDCVLKRLFLFFIGHENY